MGILTIASAIKIIKLFIWAFNDSVTYHSLVTRQKFNYAIGIFLFSHPLAKVMKNVE